MNATITKFFRCAPEGHTVNDYGVGVVVTGVVAELAVQLGYAKELPKKRGRKKLELETKG